MILFDILLKPHSMSASNIFARFCMRTSKSGLRPQALKLISVSIGRRDFDTQRSFNICIPIEEQTHHEGLLFELDCIDEEFGTNWSFFTRIRLTDINFDTRSTRNFFLERVAEEYFQLNRITKDFRDVVFGRTRNFVSIHIGLNTYKCFHIVTYRDLVKLNASIKRLKLAFEKNPDIYQLSFNGEHSNKAIAVTIGHERSILPYDSLDIFGMFESYESDEDSNLMHELNTKYDEIISIVCKSGLTSAMSTASNFIEKEIRKLKSALRVRKFLRAKY
jgi:hypothetical protein